MKFLRGRYYQYAALAIVLLISACGPTYEEKMAAERQRSFDAKMALANKQAKEIKRLFEICEVDIGDYWKHPKPPFLKSCLQFETELKHGIKDKRAGDECHDDMMEEIPSCSAWKTATNRELERLDAERW
jgi:hypothetical protein